MSQLPTLLRYNAGNWERLERPVITETPVSLTVNGQEWLTLMCTPLDLEALAVGFLFNEGIIHSAEEISLLQVCAAQTNVDVWLTHPAEKPADWRRTSGCVGGATSVPLENLRPSLADGFVFPVQVITRHMDDLLERQTLYRQSGGVHTSLLTDGTNVIASAEDVGRHNSLDKVAGKCLLENLRPAHRVLVTTGRISSEMIQKAARMGAAMVISRTSATSLSIRLAQKWGISLIGYARRDQFTVYTHPERILQNDFQAISAARPQP